MRHRFNVGIAATALLMIIACGASKEVTKAKEFIDAGMFDQAIILLKQEVQTNPKSAEAHMLLGTAYLGNGMTALAEQELNTATILDDGIKRDASKRCYEVAKYLVKTNKANAHTALMKAKEYDPESEKDEQFFFLANIDTEESDTARMEAAKNYLTLFPSGPNTAQATYELGRGFASSGEKGQAKVYLTQVAQQFPGTDWAMKANRQLIQWAEIEKQDSTLQGLLQTTRYEYGWTAGAANAGSNVSVSYYPLTVVNIRGDSCTMKYSWKEGVLEGKLSGKVFSGRWRQSNGAGNFNLSFNDDFSTAQGWWDDSSTNERGAAFLRRLQ